MSPRDPGGEKREKKMAAQDPGGEKREKKMAARDPGACFSPQGISRGHFFSHGFLSRLARRSKRKRDHLWSRDNVLCKSELVPYRGEKHFKPCPQNRILVPLSVSFQNCPQAYSSFPYGSTPPQAHCPRTWNTLLGDQVLSKSENLPTI